MDPVKCGKFIASKRKLLHMTQLELGNKIHVTDKAISKWERGLGLPDINLLEPLSEVLHVSVNELIKSEDGANEASNDSIKEVINLANVEKEKYKKKLCKNMIVIFFTICLFICMLYLLIVGAKGIWIFSGLFAFFFSIVYFLRVVFVSNKYSDILLFLSLSLALITLLAEYGQVREWVVYEDWGALLDVVPTMYHLLIVVTAFGITFNFLSIGIAYWKKKESNR